jgi:BirA family transcriptional regulator, biotin operon repressor / biotin---[acetyl-CoA-carboxylase] ligase
MWPGDPLDAARLHAELRNQLIGNRVIILNEATSTNDVVFKMAEQSNEGLVVLAERQSAGRGQHGRRWESAANKGLWFSVLLRPNVSADESPRLTRMAAEAIVRSVAQQFSLDAIVKPPNDVYFGDRKIAGVLLERRAVAGAPHVAILGIGVNVNHAPEDFPTDLRERAGSLAIALGHPVDRNALAVALLLELNRSYREESGG